MVKRVIVLLVLLACVPTPEHKIIANKGEQKDRQTEAQSVPDRMIDGRMEVAFLIINAIDGSIIEPEKGY